MAKKMPEIGEYQYGFHDKDVSIYRSERGLTENVVREISKIKDELSGCLSSVLSHWSSFTKCQCHNGAAI